MKKALLIVLAVVLVFVTIWFGTVGFQKPPRYPTAQTDIDKYFDDYRMDYSVSKSGLIEDVDTLVAFTDEMHADPYRVTDRSAFLKKAEEIKSHIKAAEADEIPALDAFYDLQELVVFLQDGHTTLYPQNWEKIVANRLPFTFTSVEGRIFVKDNFGGNNIPERVEILEINGISITQMVDDLMKYVPGTLPHLKQARLAEQFGLFIQTYYKMSSPWQITYSHNGIVTTTMVEGITRDDFAKASALRPEYRESKIEVDGKIVPVLNLEFSGWGDSEWDDFKMFIDDFFAQNKSAPYLVIDARHHLGGDGDWGVYVLSHLTSALHGYNEFSFKVSPLHQEIMQYFFKSAYYESGIPQFLWGLPIYKLTEQDDPYYWIGRGVLEAKPGTFYEAKWEDSKSYLTDETSTLFAGKAFLITSHETFSAGAYFAGLFRSNDLGPIVGRETGGRVYMESDPRPVFLPHSNLMYLIPVAKFTVCDGDPDRGVIPDITIDLTANDYINHKDKDMEQVINLIKADMAVTNWDLPKIANREGK